MKRPAIEYGLIGIGTISGILSLVTATVDSDSYVGSLLLSILVFAPFFLPWRQARHPYLYLFSLIIPVYILFIELKKGIHLYQALLEGKSLFEGLSFAYPLAFLNMHLFIPGILVLTFYALWETKKGRTVRLIRASSGSSS